MKRQRRLNKHFLTGLVCILGFILFTTGLYLCFSEANAQNQEKEQVNTVELYSQNTQTASVQDSELTDYYSLQNGVNGVSVTSSWQYLDKASGGFIDLPSFGKKLNINDTLQLTVSYNHVSKSEIISHNNTARYQMPEELIFIDGNWHPFYTQDVARAKAGNICVKNGYVYIRYEQDWLDSIQDDDIYGAFMAQGTIDISKLNENGIIRVHLGDEEKELYFEKTGEPESTPILLSKSLSDENKNQDSYNKLIKINGKYYLDYILTVTVQGDDSKSYSNVQVSDSFTDSKYIEKYCDVTGDEMKVSTNSENTSLYGDIGTVFLGKIGADSDNSKYIPAGSEDSSIFVWNLGTVQGGHKYSLHYRVEIKSEYAGQIANSNNASQKVIENNADAWYRKYAMQGNQKAIFTPKGEIKTAKKVLDAQGNEIGNSSDPIQTDEKGNKYIQYEVLMSAPEDNSWSFDNVYFYDSLFGDNDSIRSCLTFDKDSFYVNDEKINFSDIVFDGKAVRFNVGNFEAGQIKSIKYRVKVSDKIFTLKDGGMISIGNEASAQKKDADNGFSTFSNTRVSRNISGKKWARKLTNGIQTTGSQTINMNGNDITIPSGSFKYQVVVNEKGGWNVNASTFKDHISNGQYMSYIGFVKISAYDVSDITVDSSSDDSVIQSIESAKEPESVAWLDLDGKSKFEASPNEIFASNKDYDKHKSYAYILTYYTKTASSLTQVRVRNSFALSGTVGIGDVSYNIVFSNFSVDVSIASSSSYSASKKGWYYDKEKGSLYWVIQFKPEEYPMNLPSGFQIKDTPLLDSSNRHMTHVNGNCKVSILKGDTDPAEYDSYEKLSESDKYENISFDKKIQTNSQYGKWSEMLITLKEDVSLHDGEKMYVVIETKPSHNTGSIPYDRSTINYRNNASFSADGNAWSNAVSANYMIGKCENILKELEMSFEKSNLGYTMTYQKDSSYDQSKILQSKTTKNGSYYAWGLVVNYEGNLSGDAVIEDEIPDGLEVAYVQFYWNGIGYRQRPTTEAYTGSGWKKVAGDDRYGSTVSYSVKDNKIRWKVSGLERSQGSGATDRTALQFHVVCRVSDKQALMNGKVTQFTNMASIYQNGISEGIGTNTVSYTGKSVSKTIDSENLTGEFVNFSVDLNRLSEDLDKNSSMLTLVDELSRPLYFDTDSIKLYESDGSTEYTGKWNLAFDYSQSDKQIMRITVPDGKHLVLKYRTRINAKQGYIQINNVAHWEGYKTPDGADIKNKQFTYSVSAMAGSSIVPKIQIKKIDASDSSKLQGAEFEIVAKKAYDESEFTPLESHLKGVTDENGNLVFGAGSQKLETNTIYKIQETKAPQGYLIDSKPYYCVVIGKLSDDSLPDFEEAITDDNGKSYPLYSSYSDTVILNISNQKPSLKFSKQFSESFASTLKPEQQNDGSLALVEDGEKVSRFDGVYSFALSDGKKDIQWIRMTIQDGIVSYYRKASENDVFVPVHDMEFVNLFADETYTIWELDENGNHVIENQTFSLQNKSMTASYKNCSDISLKNQNNTEHIITNAKNIVLPDTGSSWQIPVICLGIILVLIGINRKSKS